MNKQMFLKLDKAWQNYKQFLIDKYSSSVDDEGTFLWSCPHHKEIDDIIEKEKSNVVNSS